mmetsp:Transcript_143/g.499  ORF Transcript_143/g.499 Transcript_143/m.499 type:complete len:254 (+) Transcript_143:387-1148(+)
MYCNTMFDILNKVLPVLFSALPKGVEAEVLVFQGQGVLVGQTQFALLLWSFVPKLLIIFVFLLGQFLKTLLPCLHQLGLRFIAQLSFSLSNGIDERNFVPILLPAPLATSPHVLRHAVLDFGYEIVGVVQLLGLRCILTPTPRILGLQDRPGSLVVASAGDAQVVCNHPAPLHIAVLLFEHVATAVTEILQCLFQRFVASAMSSVLSKRCVQATDHLCEKIEVLLLDLLQKTESPLTFVLDKTPQVEPVVAEM